MRNTAAAQRPTQRSAWDRRGSSIAIELERNRRCARNPKDCQQTHIPKPADTYRSQRIAKAAI